MPLLHFRGHHAVALTRDTQGLVNPSWDPDSGRLHPETLDGFEAIVHLSGESVAERWTSEKKERIYASRVQSTRLLSETIQRMNRKPKALICASAIGYYGDRGSQVLVEDSTAGKGFLPKVCVDWESALSPLARIGVRCLSLRFGIILSTTGGALPRIMKPFLIGAGGRLGNGQQYMSWVTVEDAVSAIDFCLQNEQVTGAANVVAPQPITNNEFVSCLSEILHCSCSLPVPVPMAHLAFGKEMSNELLLSSARVVPEALTAAGFQFQYPTIGRALEHLLRDRA